MKFKKSLLLTGYLFLVIFLAGCIPTNINLGTNYPTPSPGDLLTTGQCYQLEPTVTVQIDPDSLTGNCLDQLDTKTYVRLRQNVRIINAKIQEGITVNPNGDCTPAYTGSLREVGLTTDGQSVFWESENYQNNDLKDFILVFLKEEKGYHHFDVYIDQARQNNIPDFVKNCQETGGLIPIGDSPQGTFPPQFFAKSDIDPAGFETNFAEVETQLKDFYAKIQEVQTLPPGSKQIGRYTHTIGTNSKTYNVFFHAGTNYLEEGNQLFLYNPADTPPGLGSNTQNPTLQLATFGFITTSEWTWATPECKPVLYFYPQKPTRLNIKLNPAGYLTETDPPYDEQTGWQITARPDGTITLPTTQTYPFLHYEALIDKFKTPDEGWIVNKENLPGFFEGILPRLGLNEKEATDFKDYWLGRLVGSPYFLITLLAQEEIERIEPIEFSSPPDTFIRVRFYFKDLRQPALVNPPALSPPPARKGFTIVEWGGLYKENF